MRSTKFFIRTGRQSVEINRLLRAADLCEGAMIDNGEGYEITVQWKDDIIVDANHIERVQNVMQTALESAGLCVLSIEVAGKEITNES